MHNEGIIALKDLNKELARDLIRMDDEVDRFSLYIVRLLKAAVQDEKIIREIGLSTGQDCLGFRLITKSIERIADHAVEIAKNILLLKKPLETNLSKSIEEMSISATSVFNDSIDALFKKDYYLAETVVQKAKRVSSLEIKLLEAITKRVDLEEAFSLRLIIESIKRTAEYASDIAEIVLNMTINKILNE
jgi:phosphate uptake regulator